ncbi:MULTISPECIES: 30S ribosome-binding factor RbfA [Sporomusaceae]|uniref:30S ribosome-binding factor RbfA n=1 Tax=Sporomusaceae TaxID=1843490 RepID=UPI00036ED7EC|nr:MULTISPECIES: 30S ribosome-binding factor RbfA [Sporomusaceae]
MGQLRIDKVQEFIKQEVSQIIQKDIKDPRVGFVTVTDVEMTKDLRHAKIFLSLMGSDEQKKATWEALNRALGFMRSEIGKRIRLRCTPELSLHLDKSLDYSNHIQKLLLQLEKDGTDKGDASS